MEEKIEHLDRKEFGVRETEKAVGMHETHRVQEVEEQVDHHDILEGHDEQACIICGEKKSQGIVVVSEFICEDCEAEMVHTDVKDDKYDFFIHQMKQIWVQLNA